MTEKKTSTWFSHEAWTGVWIMIALGCASRSRPAAFLPRWSDPLSATTWVVWRLDLALPQGEHVVTVRCYDGAGAPQAGGFHSKRATV